MTTHRSAEARKRQILEGAVACFAEKGYHQTTMDDIVAAAGLSKGSLYWHFKSKKELFQSLLAWWMEEFLQGSEQLLRGSAPPGEKLRAIFAAIGESAMARPELLRAQFEFYTLAVRDADFRGWVAGMYEANRTLFVSLLEEGMASGAFRRLDADPAARMIMAYLDGAFLHREIVMVERPPDEMLAEIAETLVNLLEPAPAVAANRH